MKVDIAALRKLCTMKEKKVRRFLLSVIPDLENREHFLYRETSGATVLAVAHMDVVSESSSFDSFSTPDDIMVFSPALDDRLGVFTMTHLLKQFGLEMDLLFTTDEERCSSTAEEFVDYCGKDYNWIVGLDRKGSDVVLYDYDTNTDFVDALKAAEFKLSLGSFSDISYMEPMQTSAFNMGIGYHFQHTNKCCASMLELAGQLRKLKSFFDAFSETKFTHTPEPRTLSGAATWSAPGKWSGIRKSNRDPWWEREEDTIGRQYYNEHDETPLDRRRKSNDSSDYTDDFDYDDKDDYLGDYGRIKLAL